MLFLKNGIDTESCLSEASAPSDGEDFRFQPESSPEQRVSRVDAEFDLTSLQWQRVRKAKNTEVAMEGKVPEYHQPETNIRLFNE